MTPFLPETVEEAERAGGPAAWGVIGASALLAAASGAHPTDSDAIDAVLTAALAAAGTWGAVSAPWWAAAGLAAVALAATATTSVPLALVAGVALAAAVALRAIRRDLPWVRGVVGAVAIQVLLRLPDFAFLGAPAIVAGTAIAAIVVVGALHRPFRTRVVAYAFACIVAVGALTATIAAGVAVNSARNDLLEGADLVRDGLHAL
jgi:hypothetical protein